MGATKRLSVISTTQVPVSEHSPYQPTKNEPSEAEAVNVTEVPSAKPAEQVLPQSMPLGLLVIVPEPFPVFSTERLYPITKLAVTDRLSVISTTQVPVPEQAPDQPLKIYPVAVVEAVKLTDVP